MVQIIEENRKPSLGERLSAGIGKGLEMGTNFLIDRQRRQAMQQLGIPEDLPPELQKTYLAEKLKGASKQNLMQEKLRALGLGGNEGVSRNNLLTRSSDNGDDLENYFNEESGNFDENQTYPSDEDIAKHALIDANYARMERAAKDAAIKQRKETPGYKRQQVIATEQAKEDLNFYKELNQRTGKQILKKESLDRLKQINKKKVSGKVYESFLDKMGLTAKTSEGRRELAAEVKNQFTDFKQVAGAQLSASEFFVLAGAYPNADFSPEANEAIINNLEQVHDTLNKENEIAKRLKRKNGDKIPEFFQEKVNAELQQYVSKKIEKMKNNIKLIRNEQYGIPKGFTLMLDPNGEPLSVEDNLQEINKYMELGATLP